MHSCHREPTAFDEANEMTQLKGVVHILEERASPAPPLLYKYYAFDQWTQRIFQNNELYFQSPNAFNDPFDSVIRFIWKGSGEERRRLVQEHLSRYGPNLPRRVRLALAKHYETPDGFDELVEELKDRLDTIRRHAGVYCMTKTKRDILMWSHYAGHHTGFCLHFQTDDPFFSNAQPVSYSSTLPCVNILLSNLDEVTTKGLLTKARRWRYEKEWRIIDLNNSAGVRQFPPTVLHGVILGCRISENDKRQIVEWCKERSPRPILYYAREKEMEYGLDIDPVKY